MKKISKSTVDINKLEKSEVAYLLDQTGELIELGREILSGKISTYNASETLGDIEETYVKILEKTYKNEVALELMDK